ncbi:MAG: hypothetical protein KKE57_05665 [Proteobacteria bacterium]|nr:hypothetical protein [Pseudomonadota bacterium]
MKINRMWTSVFLGVCFFTAFGRLVAGQDPDDIAARIFLGQAYPSGNVYLKPFPLPDESQSEMDYLKSFSWPDSIFFQALSSPHPYANTIREGHISSVMHDGQHEIGPNMIQLESAYIPSLESMDDSHEGCTKEFYKPRNPQYQYLGQDFFHSVLFNCNPNEGVAIYKNSQLSKFSFPVMAFDKNLTLSEIRLLNGKPRPLTTGESAAIEREKLENKKNESECTTIPRYLDAATSHLSAKVKGSDISIRISQYETPGCAGHLANIFILDVLKSGTLLKKYEMVQYEGAI